MKKETQFDLILIGSGMGALTVGSIYSKLKNKKVLILEQHFKLGGFTHTFRRDGKFEWDVGLHYLGKLQKGSPFRMLMDLITDGEVEFNSMPEIFEKFVFPDFTFSVSSQEEKFKESLSQLFPKEKDAIIRYFQDVKDATNWFGRFMTSKSLPYGMDKLVKFFNDFTSNPSLVTTKEYLDHHFKDERLKAILVGQWGDYGLPPSMSSFVIHALIVEHYLQGGFYPDGSAKKIAESVKKIIESRGGETRLNSKVTEILFSKDKAIGVIVEEDKKGTGKETYEVYAPLIISDAGAYTTYKKLIPKQVSFMQELDDIAHASASTTLYLGFKKDPREIGIFGENYWIYTSYDHDKIFKEKNSVLSGNPSLAYLSFPSLKDTKASGHTAEIITLVEFAPFEKWKNEKWKHRGEEYNELKKKMSEGLINLVKKHIPKFEELIEYQELSTPLTNLGFTGHRDGTIYGIPCTKEKFQKEWLSPKTPFENLYLTGVDVACPGIAGAMAGGFSTLGHILDVSSIPGIFGEIRKVKLG
ncbi:MAG: NAD(P)/FAD-dependent oxidoreductase [Leptospiraceae bacterium]|nr:NAD(P)/FAD-dependent oxidoreductase [Leptospiraceae bacterium]